MNSSTDNLNDWQPQDKRGQIRLLISRPEAAAALAVCEKTIYNMVQNGDLPEIKIGKSVRYSVDDLKAWIENQKQDR